jgi:hypothetical protein
MVYAQSARFSFWIVCGEIAFNLRKRDCARLDACRLQYRLKRKYQAGKDDHCQRNRKANKNPSVEPQQNGFGHSSALSLAKIITVGGRCRHPARRRARN